MSDPTVPNAPATPEPHAGVVHRQPDAVVEQLKTAAADDTVVSLGGALPAEELFPTAELERAMAETMRADPAGALQYGWPEGSDGLRAHVVRWMEARGITVGEDEVLVTHGAQQALHLLGRLLVAEGDAVAVETPTYSAALQSFDLRSPRFLAVPRTAAGIDLPALERAFAEGARVLYLVASGHNPTGGVLTRAEREAVLDLAERHDAWVLDDDAYGAIVFDGAEPPLRSFGRHLDRVVHLGSFSKVLAPGLRVGWLAGPKDIVHEATLLKEAQDLETASLSQRVLAAWLDANSLDAHVERCLPVYRARRDAVVAALAAEMPEGVSWEEPRGGFSVLVRLPAGTDPERVLSRAIEEGVLVEPAGPYFASRAAEPALRLSYSNVPERRIAVGVRRLGRALHATLG
jgi:2-aminoadipate transaminase